MSVHTATMTHHVKIQGVWFWKIKKRTHNTNQC